ncbi:MAG: hypothetical protein ABJN26_07555 [Stappiaceae bacterium]
MITSVTERLRCAPNLRALFLAGSFGRGSADAFSDVDFVAIADPQHHQELSEHWRTVLQSMEPIIFWNERRGNSILLNAITETWLRCDFYIVSDTDLIGRAKDTLKPLIDAADIYGTLPVTLPLPTPDVERIGRMIREFIRVLGLLPVAMGRGEYVTAIKGLGLLRDMLTDLLLENTPTVDRGGILHLSRQLAQDDMALLASLPYPGPNRDEIIKAHIAIADIFLPMAKRMAVSLNMEWPQEFEAKTRDHISSALNIEFNDLQ